jgi:replicative DNA helicase
MIERLPSHIDAERYCLGSVMLDGERMDVLRGLLTSQDFSQKNHAEIWESMCLVYDSGQPVDRITVLDNLHQRGRLEATGGAGYLVGLDDGLPHIENLATYTQLLKDKTALRRLMTVCDGLCKRAQLETEPVDMLLADARNQISDLRIHAESKDPVSIAEFMAERSLDDLLNHQRGHGIPYPWPDLEHKLCGLRPGQLVVIAAHTSFGKTSMALQIASHAAKKGRGVIFFSREMEKDRLFRRMVNQIAEIDADKLRHGLLSPEDRTRQVGAATWLRDSSIYLDERSSTVPAMRAGIRRVKAAQDVGLVVVDYLQLLQGVGRHESRAKEVGANSRALKLAAIELEVPIVILSQFSRESAKDGRAPELHDLKESGDVENDADVVLLIRPKEKKPTDPNYQPVTIHIAKQREGPRNIDVDLIFRPNCQRFESLAKSEAA